MSTALLQALRGIVGAEQVLSGGDLSAWELDWRKRFRGRALAVVRPADTAQVAAVLHACTDHGASVVPQGGNTGLVGGGVPDASGTQVLLSLTRLQRIRAIDPANLTLTAEAGCVLQTVQQAAADAGLMFALSLAAEGSCTIGGNLATNAGGTQVLRFGNARELCLGLEVVTADGQVWDGLSGLRKDNTGYDLRDLFIGSEGTLGIITAATLKLHPRPAAMTTALAAAGSLQQCVALLGLAQARLGAGLTGFEVMNRFALDLVAKHFPALPQLLPQAAWTVLLEQSDNEGVAQARARFEALLEAAIEAGLIDDAVVAESLAQSQALWHLRESIPLAQAQEGPNVKHDIALPVSAIPDFVTRTDAALASCLPRHAAGELRPPRRRQPALQRAGAAGPQRDGVHRPARARSEHAGLRRGGRGRRIDLGRAWRGRTQARRTGATQVAGGSATDARHQAGAGPAGPAEPRAGAVTRQRCRPQGRHHWRSQGTPSRLPSICTPGQFFRNQVASPQEVICVQRVRPSQR